MALLSHSLIDVGLGVGVWFLLNWLCIVYVFHFNRFGRERIAAADDRSPFTAAWRAFKSACTHSFSSRGCCSPEIANALYKVVWAALRNPAPSFLYYFTVTNLIITSLASLFNALVVFASYFSNLKVVSALFQVYGVFYALSKFNLCVFYIIRYQITAQDARGGRTSSLTLIFAFWILALGVFPTALLTQISFDTCRDIMISGAVFLACDSAINTGILYLLLRPVRAVIARAKETFKTMTPTFQQDEEERVRKLERIIRKACVTCALSIVFTIVENVLFIIKYCNDDDANKASLLSISFIVTLAFYAECLVCGLAPFLNYPELMHMVRHYILFLPAENGQQATEPISSHQTLKTSMLKKPNGDYPEIQIIRLEEDGPMRSQRNSTL